MNKLFTLILVCISGSIWAQPTLVKDIYPGNEPSNPKELTVYNGKVYFNAASEDTSLGTPGFPQYELWVTDGTDTGTKMVHDLAFDVGGSTDPTSLVVANGKLFYIGYVINGAQVWATDGRDSGTYVVITAPYPDVFFGSPNNIIPFKNNIYLRAVESGSLASGIWRTDGTVPGTKRLSATATEPGGLTMSAPLNNNLIMFAGVAHTNGVTITDGTPAGTKELRQFKSTTSSNMVNYKNEVYFMSDTSAASNFELWKTNGTTAGTVKVKEINPGNAPAISFDQRMAANSKYLFFFANDGIHGEEIWRTDGTQAGTVMVKDLRSGPLSYDLNGLILCVNDRILFTTSDANGVFFNLWQTDGTEGGTWIIMDSLSTPLSTTSKTYDTTMNQLIFSDFEHLYITDGTPWGTKFITECDLSHGMQYIQELAYCNGKIIMNIYDTAHESELWKYDFTPTQPSGITALSKQSEIKVYPNPFNESFKIHAEKEVLFHSFSMMDITGKEVLRFENVNTNDVIVPDLLECGVYFYSFQDNTGNIYKGKLIKE